MKRQTQLQPHLYQQPVLKSRTECALTGCARPIGDFVHANPKVRAEALREARQSK